MEQTIPLNIVIADRTYRIKALPSNEAAIRGTVKNLNDKIVEFKTAYAGKDIQDYLAMAVIWMATTNPELAETANEPAVQEEIKKLTMLLDKLD